MGWCDAKSGDDGRLFVRCRLVACGFKTRREGLRDDLWVDEEPKTGNSVAVQPEGHRPRAGHERAGRDGSLAVTLPMSLDRSSVQFDAKEVCTKMAQRYNRVI